MLKLQLFVYICPPYSIFHHNHYRQHAHKFNEPACVPFDEVIKAIIRAEKHGRRLPNNQAINICNSMRVSSLVSDLSRTQAIISPY